MSASRKTTALALLACVACGGGGGSGEDGRPPNVLLISIDSLRADHLGCYGYERDTSPEIDALARAGVLFEAAISSTSWTLPAHAALFTGLSDSVHGTERTASALAPGFHTLAETLRSAGYRTVGLWSGPFLDPSFGLAQGFDEYVDCRTRVDVGHAEGSREQRQALNRRSHEDVTSPRLLAEVQRVVAEPQAAPLFLFVHMWDVHYDYVPPPPWDRRFDPDYSGPADGRNLTRTLQADAEREVEHTIALYDGEIAWTDWHVGQMLRALEGAGLGEDTLVVVTADHGEEFFEHGKFGHRKALFDESTRVPLVVRLPGVELAGERRDDVVSIVDVAPTILDLVGVAPLPGVSGRSLAPILRQAGALEPRAAISELYKERARGTGPLLSLRTAEWKLVARRRDQQPHSLFELTGDPLEQRDVLGTDSALEARALAALERTFAELDRLRAMHGSEDGQRALSKELEEELRALGYIGDDE